MGAAEKNMTKWDEIVPFFLVFGGCMTSIVSMEYMLKRKIRRDQDQNEMWNSIS